MSGHRDTLAALERLDPSWAACAAQLQRGAVRYLIDFHEELERRREQVEQGNTLAILQALARCCERQLPAPQWLRDAYVAQLQAFTGTEDANARPCSLDQVFTSPNLRAGHPLRTQQDRDAWALGLRLWDAVRRAAPRHGSLDSALKEVLASDDWPVKKGTARELVLMVDRTHAHLSSGRIAPFSRIFRKV